MGKSRTYKMAHSGAGGGSATHGNNVKRSASRPKESHAVHSGSAPYNSKGKGKMYKGSGNGC